MGKLKFSSRLTTFAEIVISVVVLGLIVAGLYIFSPGLFVSESKTVESIALDGVNIDNVSKTEKLALPSESPSSVVASKPKFGVGGYAWNGNSAPLAANGGAQTTEGSLMEKYGVNFQFYRQDMVDELRNMQINFVKEFDKGRHVVSERSVPAVSIMGDGVPYYIATGNKALNDMFGEGKYHLEVAGAVGISYGEDKLIAPVEWKTNPQLLKGSLISTVVGDGDWVIVCNYAAAQGIKINPDVTTYDPEAVNFKHAEGGDFVKAAEELIKSQKSGWTIELKEVKNGKLTGNKVNKKIDACSTWFPADKKIFDELAGFTDIISTKEFNNQMPTTLIVVKEWAQKNPNIVSNYLAASYTAANQMKLFDDWRAKASEAVAKTFNLENGKYWYDAFRGQTGNKNGVEYHIGGTRVFNYADAMQYYGIGGDGVNRYKAVYEQVGKYLTDLNPFNFNESVEGVGIVPFDQAVNLSYVKNVNIQDAGATYKTDYAKAATEVVASGNFNIAFNTGSADILPSSYDELDRVYNVLIQAENTKITIEGHTDNTGNDEINKDLSDRRAHSVVDYLERKGISASRLQTVTGYGSSKPIADNSTESGRAKNRRVTVTLLK